MDALLVALTLLAAALGVALWRARQRMRGLEATAARFRDGFDSTNEAIFLHEETGGRIITVNQRFVELYGYDAAEAPGLSLGQLSLGSAPYSEADALNWLDKARREGPQRFDWHARKKNGELFWVEVALGKSVLGDRPYLVATVRDVTARKAKEALAQAVEDRLGQVFSNLPVPVFAIDADHVVTHWNRACEIVTGYPATRMLGTREPWRAFYAAARPVMADVVLDGFRGNQLDQYYAGKYQPSRFIPHCFEAEDFFPHMGSNGVWLAFTAAPLLGEDGRAIGAIETLVDITHRKQAERGLRSSENRFRALIENAPDAIVVYEAETATLIDANPRAEALFCCTRDELLDDELIRAVGRVTPHELCADAIETWDVALRDAIGGGTPRFEWSYAMTDGSIGVCDVHLVRLPDESGRIYLRCSLADITYRTRAEAALVAERNFLNSLLEAIPVPVFYKDRAGRYLGVNEAFTATLGRAREEIIGHTVFDLAPPELAARYAEMDDALFAQPGRQIYEWMTQKPNGERRSVVFNKATFCGPDGRLAGLIGVILDVTELKEAHARLEELNRELESRVDARTQELRAAMDQLVQAEKLAALGHLVAGVAHELNTPIGTMLTLSTTFTERLKELAERLLAGQLRRSEATEQMASLTRAAETLTRNAHRAGDLVSSFKQVAIDQASVRRRPFDLALTVGETLATLGPLLKQHRGVVIDNRVPADITLDSYPGPFEQVLTNLIVNALLHAFEDRAGGRIEIAAEVVDSRVLLRFADDGVGIPGPQLRHIFEPFFTTKLGQGGSGLGLYLVHALVTGQLGGAIQVHSQSGHGTRFELRLPLHAPAPPAASTNDFHI